MSNSNNKSVCRLGGTPCTYYNSYEPKTYVFSQAVPLRINKLINKRSKNVKMKACVNKKMFKLEDILKL